MNDSGDLETLLSDTSSSNVLRSILFDGVTGLPTLPLVLESIKDVAIEQHCLGVIFIDTSRLEPLEEEHGWEFVDGLFTNVRNFLDSILSQFSPVKVLSIHRSTGDNFVLILSSNDAAKPVTSEQVNDVSIRLEEHLNGYLSHHLSPMTRPFMHAYNGHSILQYNSNVRFERLITRAINEAFRSALSQQQKQRQIEITQLQEIVNSNRIHIVFQPIYDLQDQSTILGYEALSRGPEGTFFESAEFLFTLAANSGMLIGLENICQVQLLNALQAQKVDGLIFVNLEPYFLENHHYQDLAIFSDQTIDPSQMVIEITERVAIKDYELVSRALENIRQKGFRIAVDDVGSGYASLQSIAYLRPDFIKVNEKMIHGIAGDFIKQEIVKTLCDLASRFSSFVIAEGIEDQRDLQTLRELQVPYGQGYLLKRPSRAILQEQ